MSIKFDKKRLTLFIVITCIFILRLIYGLTTEFWYPDQDVIQIYLIGLKFFTTGQFPYFGPDLVYTMLKFPDPCRVCWFRQAGSSRQRRSRPLFS